ncbi:hypothetical protein QS257_09890 [Terrilactibacillus sp. S3-3]|nr:hypothetical protein QS257_09890 [Terrilactibacillus sp. S3-3]
MKKLSALDILFFVLFISWAFDSNFRHITVLKAAGLLTVAVWLISIIVRLLKKEEDFQKHPHHPNKDVDHES